MITQMTRLRARGPGHVTSLFYLPISPRLPETGSRAHFMPAVASHSEWPVQSRLTRSMRLMTGPIRAAHEHRLPRTPRGSLTGHARPLPGSRLAPIARLQRTHLTSVVSSRSQEPHLVSSVATHGVSPHQALPKGRRGNLPSPIPSHCFAGTALP